MRVWLLAPVRERMGGECQCPSMGTPWAASRTLQPWRSGFFLTWWCGSGHRAIHDDPSGVAMGAFAPPSRQCWLAAHRGLFDAFQWTDSIAAEVARRCSQHSRQGDSPSWRTAGSALASPCLLSLRFCRQPERGAVLQRQQRVPHGLPQCDEPSLHRTHPRLLQEGTARSAVLSDRARGVWRCRPWRCAAAMVR